MTATDRRTKAIIFVNASSGFDTKEDAPQKLEQWFEESGIDAHVEYVAKGVNLAEKAREAVAAGHDVVVAGGGDGTLSATASGLAGTDVAFGVLPVGTLNHFARDLHLPLDLEAAAKIVCQGKTEYVDIAEVNGKTFLNNSIIGLYPIYRFRRAEKERSGIPSRLAFLAAALGVAFVLTRTFEQLADTFVLSIWPFYGLAIAGLYRLRRRRPDLPRPYRVPGYPVIPDLLWQSIT